MTEIRKGEFNKEFITRTKTIVDRAFTEKKDEFEVTLLLNCTLALVCFPIEKYLLKHRSLLRQFSQNLSSNNNIRMIQGNPKDHNNY